jgi:hypothetical protein
VLHVKPFHKFVEENITRESGGVLSVPMQNASPKGAGFGIGERSRACAHFFLPMPRRAGVSKMETQMIDPGNSQNEVAVPEQQEQPQERQEQQEQQASQMQKVDSETEQVAAEENKDGAADASPSENSSNHGKKRVKKVRQPTEAELMPRPSIWPLILAFSIAVALGGFAFNLIILGVGVIMVIASVIGWNLERR